MNALFEKLLIAFCYFELFLLIASVITLVIGAMVLVEQDRQNGIKKDGDR